MHSIYKTIFILSIGLVIASIAVLLVFGLKLGIDFKGGSILEVEFKNRPELSKVQASLADKGEINLNNFGDTGLMIKTKDLSEQEHQVIISKLKFSFGADNAVEKRFESVGPIIGQELKHKSIVAITLVLICVATYIAFVFRKMGKTLSPWTMSMAAIIALAHDVIIPLGVFSLLGKFYGIEISGIFVAAVLTILGYSVSDTVVIFDRVRENVIRGSKEGFGQIVHRSVMQTLVRSLNTTMTVLLSLVAIFFFGGESIKYFSLMLIIGIFLGAYSSIFVASPLLVWLRK